MVFPISLGLPACLLCFTVLLFLRELESCVGINSASKPINDHHPDSVLRVRHTNETVPIPRSTASVQIRSQLLAAYCAGASRLPV
uniref:Putative secreted peptide n=1 Tax=Anopheles braziliensis TaxID=58242 RepID=A0A2M3ZTC1_9DIPT